MELVRDQLLERFEIQARRKVKNFPFLMGQGVWIDSEKLGWNDEVREIIKHGTLSIGFIGLAEALKVLIGRHSWWRYGGSRTRFKIIQHMRDRVDEFHKATGLNFSLATPAEGLSGRASVKIDRKKYGNISGVLIVISIPIPSMFPCITKLISLKS